MLLPLSSFGVLFQVEQLSNPAGFVSNTEAIEGGTTKQSVTPTLSTNGYAFGYWEINGVRQTGDDNRSLTQVSTSISANTTFTAYYFSESEDTDSDGIMDWYEYRMFGSLSMGPTDDPDSDGFNNKRESELGQDPLIVDAVEWGGISGRLSTGFTYADTSMVLAVVKSDPAGFVTETSNYLVMNSTVTTSSLHGATNGYNFAYWSINGVRQAGPTGVSMSKVDHNITQTTNIIAHYKPSTEDTDGDGVMDWFELYQFGNLSQGPSDDPDGDGFSNKREGELGQEATIADTVEWGGISGRLSSGFTYADNSMVLAVIKSDPAGFVTETSNYLEENSTVTTSSLHGATNGYNFAYWSVNGVRQAGPTGVSMSKVATDVNATTTIVAHYKLSSEDTDGDGVMDWFELYQFGDLNQSGTDDPDGDGFSNKREGELGQEATIADNVEWGGISGRLSPGILYYQQQNRPPSNLELNNTLVFLNKDANQTVGSFTPTDPDDPNRVRTYTYQLLSGAGGEDNGKFNLLGRNLRASQTLTSEGNFSIQVRVRDDENASFDKNFTIRAIDPMGDDDNDGLTYEAELTAGTNPNNPDTDGDGANDGAEVSANKDPLDPSVFPNRPPRDLNSTAVLAFSENQVVGTVVGEFNATDLDGDAITYDFVNGENNNSLFTLETNGILKTATNFNYETNASTYTITVQAKDELNATTEGNFTVTLLDDKSDNPPSDLWLSNALINENTAVGTEVAQIVPLDGKYVYQPGQGVGSKVVILRDAIHMEVQFTKGEILNVIGIGAGGSVNGVTIYRPQVEKGPIWFHPAGRGDWWERVFPGVSLVLESGNEGVSLDGQTGMLSVNRIFDYEIDGASHSYSVRAEREGMHDFNKSFTLTITDIFEDLDQTTEDLNTSTPSTPTNSINRPIPQTLPVELLSNGTYRFSGKILTDGGALVYETGIILSKNIFLTDPIILISQLNPKTMHFEAIHGELEPGTTYYFRAYAKNSAGLTRGGLKKLTTPQIIDPSSWYANARPLPGGWRMLEWWGVFRPTSQNWVYHAELGWLFPSASQNEGLWLWNKEHGWQWTDDGVYPYLFRWRDSTWIYFYRRINGRPLFYNASLKRLE